MLERYLRLSIVIDIPCKFMTDQEEKEIVAEYKDIETKMNEEAKGDMPEGTKATVKVESVML